MSTKEKKLTGYPTIDKTYTYEDYRREIDAIFFAYGKKTAIACIDETGVHNRITYNRLAEIVNEIINNLNEVGIERSQRVAVVAKTTAEVVALTLALAYGGYTNVLIDETLPLIEKSRLINHADVDAIFTTKEGYDLIKQDIKGDIPVFEIGRDFTYKMLNNSATQYTKQKPRELCHEEVIAVIFSSGTTAEMKGCMVTYNSILYAQRYMLQYTNLNSKATFLDVLPLNHIAGYSSTMSCLLTGTEIGIISEMSAEKLLIGFQKYNPTNFIMIPKVYEIIKEKVEAAIDKKASIVKWYAKTAMKICGYVREKTGIKLRFLTKPIWKAALGKNMRICGCGTLPCSGEVIRFFLNLGIDFVNVYGATETGFPIAAANCNEKYPWKGAGKVNQFSAIKVVVSEPDEEGIGEIRVKTPLIMQGYFKDEELTKQVYDKEGYFKTGDLGYIDPEGYLYVTGRIKEAIVLRNGKKVSPNDVDKYYQKIVPNAIIASCGIRAKEGYDLVFLFVEKNCSKTELDSVLTKLKDASANAGIYAATQVLTIDKIPVTSVGKVKRFQLKKYAEDMGIIAEKQISDAKITNIKKTDLEKELIKIISKYVAGAEVTIESNLKKDLGLDSLSMFELSVEIENKLGISMVERLDGIETVRDILYKEKTMSGEEKDYSLKDYPQARLSGDFAYIKRIGNIGKRLYCMQVTGLENIPKDENILLCPNHESYLDAMWVATALIDAGYDMTRFCCLAAEHLKNKRFMKKAFRALGGIPVDREGNTALAIKRAKELLQTKKICMLIHPEGTRSRDGSLGEFKLGAAQLAKETGVKIVPVCVDGAFEIYPPSSKLPRCFDWRKMRRYSLRIAFGDAIEPGEKTKEEIIQTVKDYIIERKGGKTI